MISQPILEVPAIICKARLPSTEFFICDDPRSVTQVLVADEFKSWPDMTNLSLRNVVDLGANCGFFSFYLKKIYPDLIVDAAEPVEFIGNCFEYGRILNGFSEREVRLHRCAIGENVTKLYMDPNNSGSAGAFNLLNSKVALTTVDSMGSQTLESFFQNIPHCDLLKMDIEGGEFSAFDGFTQAHKIDRLFVETHTFPFANEVESAERELLWPFFKKLESLFSGKQVWVTVEKRHQDSVTHDFPGLTVLRDKEI